MILDLFVGFLLSGGWEDIIFFVAGGIGIISVFIILWFMLMFIFRMRRGSEKDNRL